MTRPREETPAEPLYDIVILGGGPGGVTAALYAARAGLNTLLLEKLSVGGQMADTSQIDNYPGFPEGIDGFTLAGQMQAGAERFGAQFRFDEATALSLREEPKRIVTSGGTLRAHTVVIATGALPRKLGLPEEDALSGRGVAYCAACDGPQFQGRDIAVAGGGNSAVADALTLSRICRRVYLVHRRDTLRADAVYLQALRDAGNIELVWNARIDAIEHTERVTGLAYTDTVTGERRTLSCEGVFVAVGRIPNTALLRGELALDAQGYIPADETCRTALDGVYAVGDVRAKALRQVVTAVADGAAAAREAQDYLSRWQGGRK